MHRLQKLSQHVSPTANDVKTVSSGSSVLSALFNGLKEECLFEKVAFVMPQRPRDVNKMNALRNLFTDAGLNAVLGYNPGSGAVKICFKLPNPANYTFMQEGRSIIKAMRGAVLWTMLGLLHTSDQREVEAIHAAREAQSDSEKKESDNMLVVNQCLLLFARQTRVAVVDIGVWMGEVSVTVDAARNQFRENDRNAKHYTDDLHNFYLAGPSYTFFSPYLSPEQLKRSRNELLDKMMTLFWQCTKQQHYYPTPALKNRVHGLVRNYFDEGIAGPVNEFRPRRTFGLYLHGLAGIGKSAFVLVFSIALRETLSAFIEPQKRTDIVRIPFNVVSPTALMRVLRVRGISDWSIERIIEQTICRSGIAVLHLEENPENQNSQEELFALVRKMLNALLSKYPEYLYNVIFLVTSNYEPAPSLVQAAAVVPIEPPTRDIQALWCTDYVQRTIMKHLPRTSVNLTVDFEDAVLGGSNDMRKLDQLRLSVAYHVVSMLKQSNALVMEAARIAVKRVKAHKGEHAAIQISFVNHQDRTLPSLLRLISYDEYFYHNPEQQQSFTPASKQLAKSMSVVNQHSLHTMCEMASAEVLTPAVVVLNGKAATPQRATQYINLIRSLLRNAVSDANGSVCEIAVTVREEADKKKLFGNPDPATSPFLRFMDRVNNPIYDAEPLTLGLVHFRVSEMGQFVIRELLENNDSQTHVTKIRKTRIMFVVSMDQGSILSPQVRSRAQHILDD